MILKRPAANSQQDILDKARVKELVEFERFCRDNAMWEEMNKCYASDSEVIVSWYQGSGHGFVEASSKMKERAPHKIYNTAVWLNSNKAVAIMLVTIQKRDMVNGCLVELMSDAKITYRVQKTNELWCIAGMEAIYEKDAVMPVFPNGNLTIPTSEISSYRESYACLTFMLKKSGYDIDENLPGIDKSESVEKLYKELDEWLSK